MFRYVVSVVVLVFSALGWMYFSLGVSKIHPEKIIEPPIPHLYEDSSRSIKKIYIRAVYFIPKNKLSKQIPNWNEIIETHLLRLKEFHALQLQGHSELSYTVHSKPVIGFKDNLVYDTLSTQHGNPEALRRVAQELEERNLIETPKGGVYQVLLIVYEGVGAGGSENVALVSSTFLFEPRYAPISTSILAHEFYHTLGLPDAYEFEKSAPLSEDLMGLGRSRPIDKTYLNKENLRKLGI